MKKKIKYGKVDLPPDEFSVENMKVNISITLEGKNYYYLKEYCEHNSCSLSDAINDIVFDERTH